MQGQTQASEYTSSAINGAAAAGVETCIGPAGVAAEGACRDGTGNNAAGKEAVACVGVAAA